MKKVINITLGGLVFAIEQPAYDALENYLKAIRSTLTSDDAAEVVADIETAIAEKFVARNRSEKIAVTEEDVKIIVTEMGTPADFGGEEDSGAKNTKDTSEDDIKKRLYRDTDDVVIAGVASGIAKYFDIDPVIVRVLFVISIFFNGLGLIVYVLLWLVVPAAETTTQKYAMRGEKVTLKEITERVKKNLNDLESSNLEKARGIGSSLRNILVKLFEVVGVLIRVLAKVIRYILGFIFVVGGALSIAGLVSAYCVILLSDRVLMPAEVQTSLEIMLSSTMGVVAITASFVMMIIPMLIIVVAGACLIAKRNYFTVTKLVTLFVVWVVAIILAFTASALQVEKVMQAIGPLEDTEKYNIHINVDDTGVNIEREVVEEGEKSLPPETEPIELPDIESANIE